MYLRLNRNGFSKNKLIPLDYEVVEEIDESSLLHEYIVSCNKGGHVFDLLRDGDGSLIVSTDFDRVDDSMISICIRKYMRNKELNKLI